MLELYRINRKGDTRQKETNNYLSKIFIFLVFLLSPQLYDLQPLEVCPATPSETQNPKP